MLEVMKKSDLIYKDEDYEIYKKYAGDIGTLGEQLDVLEIGIAGIKQIAHHFKFKEDYNGLIDKLVADLEKQKLP